MITDIVRSIQGDDEVKYLHEYRGLSTDEKPNPVGGNGSTFFEIDTGDMYIYDGENGDWIALTGA